ncbi:hypothetical protein [Hymenobacter sp. UYCo722]|uniref:outer membrane beta-barrel protein n=1 Tax=Hymenobacter sp. UYCo722 TaxID=3156335 RepID=UPI0033917655
MKTNLLLLALLGGTATAAHAQTAIPAGTVSLGGNVGYYRHTQAQQISIGQTGESVSSQFQLAPSVGYFVADNLAVGLNLSYTATKNTYTSPFSNNLSNLTPSITFRSGAYVQYYKMLTDQFGLVGTFGAGYQYNRTTNIYGPAGNMSAAENKQQGYYASLTPGIVYFPIPKLGISATVGNLAYSRLKETPNSNERITTDFGASFGLSQLQFGGTWYFGR